MFTHGGSNRRLPDGAEGVDPEAIVSKRSMACLTMAFRRSGLRCTIALSEATALLGLFAKSTDLQRLLL